MFLSPNDVLKKGLRYLHIDSSRRKSVDQKTKEFCMHCGPSPLVLANIWYDMSNTDFVRYGILTVNCPLNCPRVNLNCPLNCPLNFVGQFKHGTKSHSRGQFRGQGTIQGTIEEKAQSDEQGQNGDYSFRRFSDSLKNEFVISNDRQEIYWGHPAKCPSVETITVIQPLLPGNT
jgi:hypothetical protein